MTYIYICVFLLPILGWCYPYHLFLFKRKWYTMKLRKPQQIQVFHNWTHALIALPLWQSLVGLWCCVRTYIYICIYLHIYTYNIYSYYNCFFRCRHTNMHKHTYMYIETYIYRRVCIYAQRHVYIYIITYTNRSIHVYPGTIVTSQSRVPLKSQ